MCLFRKVKQTWICIAPCREHTSKALRYGTRSQGISQFYLHMPRSSANEMNLPAFAFPAETDILFYRPQRDGRLSWLWVAGWLHTEINVEHRELNPDTVTRLSTNRARRRLTSLIEADALTTTPDHQPHMNLTFDLLISTSNQFISVPKCTYKVVNLVKFTQTVCKIFVFTKWQTDYERTHSQPKKNRLPSAANRRWCEYYMYLHGQSTFMLTPLLLQFVVTHWNVSGTSRRQLSCTSFTCPLCICFLSALFSLLLICCSMIQ